MGWLDVAGHLVGSEKATENYKSFLLASHKAFAGVCTECVNKTNWFL